MRIMNAGKPTDEQMDPRQKLCIDQIMRNLQKRWVRIR